MLGGLLLRYAALESGPLRALFGASLATTATWMTSEYIDERWWADRVDDRPITSHRDVWRAITVVCAATAILLLVGAEIQSSPEMAFAGLMLLAIGAGPLVALARGRGADTLKHPGRWMLAGLIVGSAAVAALILGHSSWLIFVTLVVGACCYGRGLEHHFRAADDPPKTSILRWFPGTTGRTPVVSGIVAAAVIAISLIFELSWLTSIAVWVMLVSMMAIGAARRRIDLGAAAELGALIGGAWLAALASWFVWSTGVAGDSQRFLIFIAAITAAAGATLIWRLELIFVAVIVGFMFVWGHASFIDGNDDVVSASEAEFSIVAFGDSYISGEGAARFYPGTDQRGDDRNECRRAPTAYPVLLAERLDASLEFLSCSGAKLRHIVDLTPEPTEFETRAAADEAAEAAEERKADRLEKLPCVPDDDRLYAQYPCGPDDVYGNDLQLTHVQTAGLDLGATDLVLLSIGGNDARFGEVVTGCLLPGSCAERRETWLDGLEALGLELQAGYEALRVAFGDGQVPIVVMPYPIVMTESSCSSSPLDTTEHEFVVEFTAALNQQIEAATTRAGVHFFDDGIFSFERHRVCEPERAALNLIKLQPTDGPLSSRMDPGSWTHNSMHPNEFGHTLIEERLFAWLAAEGLLDGATNPEPGPDAVSEVLDLRSTRPFVIDPTTAADLIAEPPPGSACDFDTVEVFATRTEVFDEEQTDGSSLAPRIPIDGADPRATICITNSVGEWRVSSPAPADNAKPSPVENDERPAVTLEDAGRVFVQGGRPAGSCTASDGSAFCDFQWVMYSPPLPPTPATDDTTGDGSDDGDTPAAPPVREWRLQAINYCTVDPDCPDSISDWTEEQIDEARNEVLPALGLVFVGGWLFALGVEVNRRRARRLAERVARWLGFDRIESTR